MKVAVCAAMVVAGLALAACGRPPAATSTATSKPASAVSSTTSSGQHVVVDISYPTLSADEAVLDQALHQAAAQAKKKFLASLPNIQRHPALASRQFELHISFAVVSRTHAFVSVRETGEADFGGAHPAPISDSFVYATKTRRLIGLDDLFASATQARAQLAALARKALEAKLLAKVPGGTSTSAAVRKEWLHNMRQMIVQGTAPTAANFSQFVVTADADQHATGIMLIFPPYQVAPYVYGTQTVIVLAGQLASLLKPTYQSLFASD